MLKVFGLCTVLVFAPVVVSADVVLTHVGDNQGNKKEDCPQCKNDESSRGKQDGSSTGKENPDLNTPQKNSGKDGQAGS